MFLSKDNKGVYQLYYINPLTCKRTKKSTKTTSLREAIRFRNEFNPDDPAKVSPQEQIKYNLYDLKVEVLEYAKNNMANSTYELYKKAINNLISFLGNKRIASVSYLELERFKNHRAETVSKTSANMEIRTIKAIMNFAVKSDFILKNPAANIKQFRLPEKEKMSFSNQDLEQVFNVITDPIIGRIVMFALNTGLRLSEILNIQIKDINYEERYLTIRNKADFKTKTGKIRLIPFSEGSERIVNPYKGKSGDRYLFSFKGTYRLNKDYVSQKFKKYLRAANLPEKFHFHCLRHTFITNLIKNGVPINFVKELAGHSDIQTTMGYIHIEIDNLRKTMDDYKLAI
jgi:integrase/recombinase XerD